jgi:hypothetical protein
MARFIPNAEIHEPCAMGGQIRGGVVQKAVVRTPRTKKAPAIYRALDNRGNCWVAGAAMLSGWEIVC